MDGLHPFDRPMKLPANKGPSVACLRRTALTLALIGSFPALAGAGDPLSLVLGVNRNHDDNMFKAPSSVAPVSDTVQTETVGLLFDTHLSRQEFHAEVYGNSSHYDRLKYLDNTSSRRMATWQGAFGHSLKADASWNYSTSLAGFADFRATIKNIVTSESRSFRAQYVITPDWSFQTVYTKYSFTNGVPTNKASDSESNSREAGFRYESALGNRMGIVARTTEGGYPNRQLVPGVVNHVDNSYRQTDGELSTSWAVSGASRLSLRGARTRREHDDVPQRDFSGYTGDASWDWAPSAKTALRIYAKHDLGATEMLLANYAITRTYGLNTQWQASAKISTSLSLENRRRTFGGDPRFVLSGTPATGDMTRSASLAIQYAVTNRAQVSVTVKHDKRTADDPLLPYVSNSLGLNAQITF